MSIYNVPIESIYNFLGVLSRRGEYNSISSIIEKLSDKLNINIDVNHQLFTLLIQSLRIGNQSQSGYLLFQQAVNEFNVEPSLPLLLQVYMVYIYIICARI